MQQVFTLEQIKQIVTPIAKKHDVRKLSIFGSYARNEADADSDVDLFVDAPNLDTLFLLLGLRADLEDALGKEIDLVTAADISYAIQKNDPLQNKFIRNLRKDAIELYAKQ